MKRLIRISSIAIFALLAGFQLNGQCVPDTANCKDTDIPGQICPMFLPDATLNAYYDEVITVLTPGEIAVGETTYYIDYIVIDSVTNLPNGISYATDAEKFYADSANCVQIYGTPEETGIDTLSIYVTPYVLYGGNTIPGPQAVDDSSVIMTVLELSNIDPQKFNEFQILPNTPNPFSDVTRIGFYTPFDDRFELMVYNILGILVHQEKQGVPPGEFYFEFNGRSLSPGTYFYRVNNQDQYLTGKFIKTRR